MKTKTLIKEYRLWLEIVEKDNFAYTPEDQCENIRILNAFRVLLEHYTTKEERECYGIVLWSIKQLIVLILSMCTALIVLLSTLVRINLLF